MAADQAKDRGNRAFSAANYMEALSCFSEALALHDRTGDGQAHVYYSNRSACYLKLGDAAKALQDAEACIQAKRDWPRGYSRKGAALYQLNRLPEALRAYQDGLAVDPANAGLKDGLRSVQAKIAGSSSAGASEAGARPGPGAKTLMQLVAGDKRAMFQTLQFAIRAVLLVTFISAWIPVVLPVPVAFSLFFKLSLFNYLSYLMFAHGLPKWSSAYAQSLLMDPATQSFFYCLVFFVSRPYGLAMVPIFLVEMVHFFGYLANLLQVLKLEHAGFVTTFTTKALVPLTAKIISEPTFPTQTTAAKWATLYRRMPQVAALVEVAFGLSLIFELLTPARNFLVVMLYWQQLRVRYMISTPLQQAFGQLNRAIMSVTSHPRCPAIIRTIYSKIQAFAKKMTDMTPPQQAGANGAAGAGRPRCTIM